jgi:hypothetical protein
MGKKSMGISQKNYKSLQSILLLFGSFTFAFLLGEIVHEYGHYLAHLAYGNESVRVHLDPFGSSRIVGVLPTQGKWAGGVTAAAGPLLNLVLGTTSFIVLWNRRNPLLLPGLMWGPVVLIQEGVTFSVGFLTPGGDAAWVAALGIPEIILLCAGISLLATGVTGIARLLPLAGIEEHEPFLRKSGIILAGMVSLMGIRFVYSLGISQHGIQENLVPLIFSIMLAILVAAIQKPLGAFLGKIYSQDPYPASWKAPAVALGLGVSVSFFQIFTS